LKKVGILICCCILVGYACNHENPPEPLPPNDFLVDLILDLHIAEGPMSRIGHDQRDSVGLIVRKKIAAKHGITHEYLEEIISRLQLDPVLNVEIYDSVVVHLNRMQKEKSVRQK